MVPGKTVGGVSGWHVLAPRLSPGQRRYGDPGPDLAGGCLGPSSLGVTKWETVKA